MYIQSRGSKMIPVHRGNSLICSDTQLNADTDTQTCTHTHTQLDQKNKFSKVAGQKNQHTKVIGYCAYVC